MSRITMTSVIVVAILVLPLTGCMPKFTIEEMKADMPKRPPELDRLNAFVGKWEYDGVAKSPMFKDVESLKTTGKGHYKWEGNNWYLVGRGLMQMEHFDEMQALETWTYDTKAKCYRSTWVDTMGMLGIGESRYDEKTDTWHSTAISYGPWGKSNMKGTMHFLDADYMEWEWTEYMGLSKTMEMSGTGKRVK